MKKLVIYLSLLVAASQYGCKKFLDITPIDKLTGNNFYQTVDDVEANINQMYGSLYSKYSQTATAAITGEARSGEVIPANQASEIDRWAGRVGGHTRIAPNPSGNTTPQTIPGSSYNDYTGIEDLLDPDRPYSYNRNGSLDWARYNFRSIMNWNPYYQVIQSANILVGKLEEGIPALNDAQTRRYIAEAKFIRNFCYLTLVRLYGDVVYYTKPFQKDPLPRENMVSVVNKCIADMKANYKDLPRKFTDPSLRGVRATQGAAIGLMMHLNMWNAGFDLNNRPAYWSETAALGQELITNGDFRLLDISEWSTVTKGRSEESLFELFNTINYNIGGGFAANPRDFGYSFTHFPYRRPEYVSRFNYNIFTEEYMRKLYPDQTSPDLRLNTWFVAPFDQNNTTFQLLKFAGNTLNTGQGPDDALAADNSYLIMRYADAVLLAAEANANLGNDNDAIAQLQIVRKRASVPAFPGAPGDTRGLKDAIFWERAKELMGEGHRYFDLVRTRRIMNREYADNILTTDKFNRGAWTWPIEKSARNNNPYMTLNQYWQNLRNN
ncbi:RagB/SusD family nutrient uptake outer membrane protein [Pedobacter deserti]|uniref:RagB/SusD family nutrient uptake outer membrane protein n=1 Tax=Pedobacter deserti TaxID=2817382 RepID=UPI00210D083B|nr:RagB/SusD family nutrient uptake outer membrane protein [Pedobacter sp. SYSU D00382]